MPRNHPKPPAGLILLSQTWKFGIDYSEMTRVARERHGDGVTWPAEVKLAAVSQMAIESEDWSAARRVVETAFHDEIEPLRAENPGARIIYFGSAPIPLAIQLGALLGTGEAEDTIDVVPRHHRKGTWEWIAEGEGPRLRPVSLPDLGDRTDGVAIVRVSTSHHVDTVLTRETVGDVPLVEIDIALEQPGEDAFTRIDEMHEVAARFRAALDHIGDRFPGVYRVHLFASVQPGMALLLGTQVSRMHPEIQTYQYARNETSGPYHTPAILINGRHRPARRAPDDRERQRAASDRDALNQDIKRMSGFAEDRGDTVCWLQDVLPGAKQEGARAALTGPWSHLPAIDRIPLCKTKVDLDACTIDDSFAFRENTWRLDDSWLARLGERLPDDEERRSALRLLVLHEAVHRGPQGLNGATSLGVGRFPKVLEKIDYHADLWAMLHERALTRRLEGPGVAEPAAYFRRLIRIATETMWAFDDHGEALHRIQVRRLHRYLNWYWQSLRLKAVEDAHGTTSVRLEEALYILARHPSIELAGPKPIARDERVYFPLDPGRVGVPELAVYHRGKLHRCGQTLPFDIIALLETVKNCDSGRLLEILGAVAPSILS